MRRHLPTALIGVCVALLTGYLVLRCPNLHAAPPGITDGTKVNTLKPLFQGKKLALAVGINKYQDPHWYPLKYAASDAQRFHGMMRRGGFHKTQLLHTFSQTTLQSIKRGLQRLKRANTSPYDTIVIYISAHGTVLAGGQRSQRYIITADTDDENIAGTGLSVAWLRQQLKTFPSRRKALILATCYTGKPNTKSRFPRGQKGAPNASPMPYSTTMLILNAASHTYSAYESKKLKSDVYTHFLLSCIKTLAKQTQHGGRVSALQAHSCAVNQTYRYVMKHRGVRQLPGLEADVTGLEAVYLFGQPQKQIALMTRGSGSSTLKSKGAHAIVQLPRQLLAQYQVTIWRDLGGPRTLPSNAQRFLHPGDVLTTLAAGTYSVRFRSRKTGQHRIISMALRQGQRVMLQPPRWENQNQLALSVGMAQGGPLLLEGRFLSLGLTYRRSFWAIGLLWDGLGRPEGTSFSLMRLGIRGELSWLFRPMRQIGLSLGGFVVPGTVLRTSATGEVSAGFFLNTGGVAAFHWYMTRHISLHLATDLGIDLTPTTQSLASFYWRVYSAIAYAF